MAWDTSVTTAAIVSKAARDLGLVSADIDNPFASSDTNILQLCSLLDSFGQDMVRDFQWSHLTQVATLATVNGTANYALASDYQRMVDGSQWNRTQQWPLGGPIGPQGWELLQAWSALGPVQKLFRVWRNQVYLSPTPTAVETLAYEYVSAWWVDGSSSGAPTTDTTSAKTDILWFDKRLLVTGLKLEWQKAKGFDTTGTQGDFDRALARAQGGDGAGPTLRIGGRTTNPTNRLLDGNNLPETGYGGT